MKRPSIAFVALLAALALLAAPARAQSYTSAQGTTSNTWRVGGSASGAVTITDNGGVVELRDAANSSLIIARVAIPVASTDAANKGYVDAYVGGLALPSPASGCLYLDASTSTLSYVACSGSTPSGTGFVHVTSGTQDSAARAVDLASSDVADILPVANGGTDAASLTAHALLAGEGTSAVSTIGPCASGVPILGAGSSADPTCSALNLAGGSSVVTNQLPLANLAPGESGQIPITNSGATAAAWVTPSGDLVVTADGVATVGGLLGVSLPSLASGCLASTGSAWEFTSCSGGSTPTGTGFVHVTSGSQDSAARAVDVSSSDITGVQHVANGGTGGASFDAHGVLLGEGTSAFALAAPGTAGLPLLSTGASSDPAFGQLDLSLGSTLFTNTLATSLLSPGSPAQVLLTNAGTVPSWTTVSGDGTLSSSGALSISGLTIASQTEGDILYYTGSAWTRLAAGTDGYVLTQGAAVPAWTALPTAVSSLTGDVTGTQSGASIATTVESISGSSPVAITPNALQWVAGASPTLSQASTSGASGANIAINPQASTNANASPGGVTVGFGTPAGTGAYPSLQFTESGMPTTTLGFRSSNRFAMSAAGNAFIQSDGTTTTYLGGAAGTLQIFASSGPQAFIDGHGVTLGYNPTGENLGGCIGCLGLDVAYSLPTTLPSTNGDVVLYGNSSTGALGVDAYGIEFPSFVSGPTISGAGLELLTTSGTLTLDSSTIADSTIDIGIATTGPIIVGNSATSVTVRAPLSSKPDGYVSAVLTEAHQGTHGSQAGNYDRGLFGFGSIVSEGGAVQLLKVPTTTNKAGVLRATVTCRVTSGSGGDTVGAVAMDIGTVTFTNISGTTTLVGSEDYWESITNASNMATGMNVSAAVDGDGSSVDLSVGYISESVSGDCTATAEALQN